MTAEVILKLVFCFAKNRHVRREAQVSTLGVSGTISAVAHIESSGTTKSFAFPIDKERDDVRSRHQRLLSGCGGSRPKLRGQLHRWAVRGSRIFPFAFSGST